MSTQSYDLVLHRPDATRVHVTARLEVRRNEQGHVVALTGTIQDVTARDRAARLLVESEERFGFALDAAGIGDWDMDLRTNVARRSLRHDHCFGYREPVAEWGYDTFLAHIDAVDRDRVDERYQVAMSGGGDYDVEFRVTWPDGSVHWLWSKGRFFFDDTGRPYQVASHHGHVQRRPGGGGAPPCRDHRVLRGRHHQPGPVWGGDQLEPGRGAALRVPGGDDARAEAGPPGPGPRPPTTTGPPSTALPAARR